jgi:hypothetical protein
MHYKKTPSFTLHIYLILKHGYHLLTSCKEDKATISLIPDLDRPDEAHFAMKRQEISVESHVKCLSVIWSTRISWEQHKTSPKPRSSKCVEFAPVMPSGIITRSHISLCNWPFIILVWSPKVSKTSVESWRNVSPSHQNHADLLQGCKVMQFIASQPLLRNM